MFQAVDFLEDNFKRPDNLARMLALYKLPTPPVDTVRKWLQRGSVPSEWIVLLLLVLEFENGSPVSLARYYGEKAA